MSFIDPDGWHQPRRHSNLKLYVIIGALWLAYWLVKRTFTP